MLPDGYKEGHLFKHHFFSQSLDPKEFCLHEDYYYVKDGKVCELESGKPTGDSVLNLVVHGEDLGLLKDRKAPMKRKVRYFKVRDLKRWIKSDSTKRT